MKRNPSNDGDERDSEWMQARYEQIVSSPWIRQRAVSYAEVMCAEGDPPVTLADVMAARPYLRRCLENMSTTEAAAKEDEELAALWGRGAYGQTLYRAGGRFRAGGKSRSKQQRSSDDE